MALDAAKRALDPRGRSVTSGSDEAICQRQLLPGCVGPRSDRIDLDENVMEKG